MKEETDGYLDTSQKLYCYCCGQREITDASVMELWKGRIVTCSLCGVRHALGIDGKIKIKGS